MSEHAMEVKYPMVELISGAIVSLVYLNVLTVMGLSVLGVPWVFMKIWTEGLEKEAVPELKRTSASLPHPTGTG
jgi:hypothetical protein